MRGELWEEEVNLTPRAALFDVLARAVNARARAQSSAHLWGCGLKWWVLFLRLDSCCSSFPLLLFTFFFLLLLVRRDVCSQQLPTRIVSRTRSGHPADVLRPLRLQGPGGAEECDVFFPKSWFVEA